MELKVVTLSLVALSSHTLDPSFLGSSWEASQGLLAYNLIKLSGTLRHMCDLIKLQMTHWRFAFQTNDTKQSELMGVW